MISQGISVSRPLYLVDDEIGVRLALTDLIEQIGYSVTAFDGGHSLVAALDTIEPACILLDMQMPGMSGFDVISHLLARYIRWPVVAMTAHGDVPMAVQAMKMGAADFIEKPFSPVKLAGILDQVSAAWSHEQKRQEEHQRVKIQLSVLTGREQDVLSSLALGKQNKEVAFDLDLSVRTVEMHRANMLNKLGLRSIQEATALLVASTAEK